MRTISILLEITIYSGILFCAILLIKLCFRSRMSPLLHFVIWGLLIARLLIPVTLESSVHLFVIPAETSSETVQEAQTPESSPEPMINTNAYSSRQAQPQANTGGRSAAASSAAAGNTPRQAVSLSTEEILLTVWLTGTGIGVLYLAALYALLRRRIRRNAQAPTRHLLKLFNDVKAELNIKRNVKLIGQCEYGTPAILFPNIVLMPVGTAVSMSDEEIKLVLRHELMHFKRGDHLMSLLLSLLNAVYWFNPIVWLAFKQVHADMETACDSEVVRRFSGGKKTAYAAVILSLFSKKQYGNLALGMGQGNTKKIAERRIRGVFMNNRTNKKVKITAILLTSLLLFTCFTTACQPTPEEEIVVGKNDGNLDSIIESTPAPTINIETGQQNETWQEQMSGNNVTINIDAEIVFPQTAQLPVVEVDPITYTEDDAWKAVKVFFQDATVHDEPLFTKEVLEAQIVALKKELADMQSGTIDGDVESTHEQIEYYSKLLQNAPSENDETQALTDLSFKEQNGRDVINLSANIGNNGYPATLMITRNPSEYNSGFYFSNRPEDITTYPTTENNMEMTLDEAVSLAKSKMTELGLEDMILAESGIEGSANEQGYVLNFIKSVNGIGIFDYQTHMMTQQEGEASVYAPFLHPEQVAIYINNTGILKFYLSNALAMREVINDNVETLSIDEVKDVFRNQVFYNYYAPDNHPLTINVNKIVLGYFIQSVKDQPGVFRAIPVWDFLAGETAYEGDSYTYSVLTINAIDGSIVDRSLSY